jgi:hypothetical protein
MTSITANKYIITTLTENEVDSRSDIIASCLSNVVLVDGQSCHLDDLLQVKAPGESDDAFIQANSIIIIDSDKRSTLDIIERCRWRVKASVFIAVVSPRAADDAHFRLACFDAGANMVAHDTASLVKTITECVDFSSDSRASEGTAHVEAGQTAGGRVLRSKPTTYLCPYCKLSGLKYYQLRKHCPAFHINVSNSCEMTTICPLCDTDIGDSVPMQVHIHEGHNNLMTPHSDSTSDGKPRRSQFSLVLCRHPTTNKYLLCQEFANLGFWNPGNGLALPCLCLALLAFSEYG